MARNIDSRVGNMYTFVSKSAADGGGLRLISSADVPPRGEGAIESKYMKRIWPTKLTACFRFQFGLRDDDVGDW